MKNRQFIVFALLLACPLLLHGQETFLCGKESCNKGYIRHPWYGKKGQRIFLVGKLSFKRIA